MTSKLRVRILGGGLSGLSTAHSLVKKCKFPLDLKLIEKTSSFYPQSSFGIHLGLNGVLGLRDLKLLKPLITHSAPIRTVTHYSETGAWLGSSNWSSRFLGTFGCLPCGFIKSDIEKVLEEELPANVVHRRQTVSTVARSDSNGTIQIEYDDGTREECDLLIGATGSHSKIVDFVREKTMTSVDLIEHKHTFDLQPIELWTGYAPENISFSLVNRYERATANFIITPHGRCILFPVGGLSNRYRVWFFLRYKTDKQPDIPDFAAFQKFSALYLGEAFSKLVSASVSAETFFLPNFKLNTHWTRDNIALVGDSACQLSPIIQQGTSLALEAAVTLGNCLSDFNDVPNSIEIKMALKDYESIMQTRSNALLSYGNKITSKLYDWDMNKYKSEIEHSKEIHESHTKKTENLIDKKSTYTKAGSSSSDDDEFESHNQYKIHQKEIDEILVSSPLYNKELKNKLNIIEPQTITSKPVSIQVASQSALYSSWEVPTQSTEMTPFIQDYETNFITPSPLFKHHFEKFH